MTTENDVNNILNIPVTLQNSLILFRVSLYELLSYKEDGKIIVKSKLLEEYFGKNVEETAILSVSLCNRSYSEIAPNEFEVIFYKYAIKLEAIVDGLIEEVILNENSEYMHYDLIVTKLRDVVSKLKMLSIQNHMNSPTNTTIAGVLSQNKEILNKELTVAIIPSDVTTMFVPKEDKE